MGNRDYKKFAEGAIVHVYNRGNNREKIFHDEQDYRAFLYRLGLVLGFETDDLTHELLSLPFSRIRIVDMKKGDFLLHAFSLIPNHFHLLLEQRGEISVSKLMLKVCTSYAKYINKKYKRVGHIFQDEFKSVLMESNSQLMWTSAYIHINSVKDFIVKNPEEYKWSSYNDFILKRGLPIVHKDFLLNIFEDQDNFKKETLRLASEDPMSKVTFDT